MRLSVVELSEDGTIFYNLGPFKEHKDLMVFPMHQFQNLYKESNIGKASKNIIKVKNLVHDPLQMLKTLEPHIELLECEIELLHDFDTKTT